MSITKLLRTDKNSVLARAMNRYKAREADKHSARIGFLIDATGSREHTWEQAQTIQARLFRTASGLKAIKLRLVYFGGNKLTALSWKKNARSVARHMAAVRCKAGLTQILEGLQKFANETPEDRAAAIILVGDCFEEDSAQAEHIAAQLKDKGIKIFSFIEGDDWTAHSVFQRLAEITGGRFAKFGDELPLADLCEGVALLTSGSKKALRRLKNEKARLLLSGPPKL